MHRNNIIIGTRGSELALWQANYIKNKLWDQGISSELKIIKTQGDKVQELSFDKMEGKGFFTKELEEALLQKNIDMAVHSHKDLPTTIPVGLCVAAVSEREDPSEIILIRKEAFDEKMLWNLKFGARVGTSSARRKSQLRAFRNDIQIHDLRGNIATRIQKLKSGLYDAIMMASAGITRLQLNLDEFEIEKLSPKHFVPAPAQGVLALEIREDDHQLKELLQKINNSEVALKSGIERKVLHLFEGGCQLPLGVYCEKEIDEEDQEFFSVWVSKAASSSKAPLYAYFESNEAPHLAENIVQHLNQIKPHSVFITRNIHKQQLLYQSLDAQGFEVNGKSLIHFNPIPIKEIQATEWIFFSSKHAVEYFFKQKPELQQQKYGVISKSTADALRKFGKRADFIGQSTDTKIVGKQFVARVGKASVLFPIAKGSLRSIQNQFIKKEQVYNLPVYETIENLYTETNPAQIYVFTSPSNVDAFFKTNTLHEGSKVVALGGATEATLKKYGVRKCILPLSFDDIGLLQAIYKIAI